MVQTEVLLQFKQRKWMGELRAHRACCTPRAQCGSLQRFGFTEALKYHVCNRYYTSLVALFVFNLQAQFQLSSGTGTVSFRTTCLVLSSFIYASLNSLQNDLSQHWGSNTILIFFF